jgi:hypothetical protein
VEDKICRGGVRDLIDVHCPNPVVRSLWDPLEDIVDRASTYIGANLEHTCG